MSVWVCPKCGVIYGNVYKCASCGVPTEIISIGELKQ